MTPNPRLIKEAQDWLDQLDKDLNEELWFAKSGEEFLRRMEWEIHRYQGEMLEAIKVALGYWLRGNDKARSLLALDLIDRLRATEYLSELEQLRDQLQTGRLGWPLSRLDLVEIVIKHLRDVEKNQRR
ncbi:MAG: hypothetical protein ACM3S0_17000 [Acidobacteriota bacterium]